MLYYICYGLLARLFKADGGKTVEATSNDWDSCGEKFRILIRFERFPYSYLDQTLALV